MGTETGPRPRESEASFRALYERSAPRLRAYLRRMTGSPEMADDVLQDAYVRYLGADVPEAMTEEQTMSYLYTTATRLVYDRWRRQRTERRWKDTTTMEKIRDPEPVGLRRDVEQALERLKPRDRAMLWLAYAEGRAHREIAEIMDVKQPSVRVLLFRARKRLAGILEEHGLTPEALG